MPTTEMDSNASGISSLPPILYKYVPVKTADLIVSNGTLRFHSPTEYNDPLDSQWDIFWQYSSPQGKKIEREVIREAILDPRTWPSDASPERLKALQLCCDRYTSSPENDRPKILEECIDSQCDDGSCYKDNRQSQLKSLVRPLRILCLGEGYDVILKWSHYADQHRGIVFGFDTSALNLIGDKALKPVRYKQNLPALFDLRTWMQKSVFDCRRTRSHPDWDEFTHTKHIDWQYELEWRSVFRDTGSSDKYWDYRFPFVALKEVIFGCRCTQEDVALISRTVIGKYPEATLYQASLHPHKFAIERSTC